MKVNNKIYFILVYIYIIIFNRYICECKLNEDDNINFLMDSFDENNNFLKRYNLTFNINTDLFNEYASLYFMYEI